MDDDPGLESRREWDENLARDQEIEAESVVEYGTEG